MIDKDSIIQGLRKQTVRSIIVAILLMSMSFCLLYIIPTQAASTVKISELSISKIMEGTQFNEDGKIIVKGEGLDFVSKVYVNGEELPVLEHLSDSQITFILPNVYYQKSGILEVQLENTVEDIVHRKSNVLEIEVVSKETIERPKIVEVLPNKIYGEESFEREYNQEYITIVGENFTEDSVVIINGSVIEATVFIDESLIKAKVTYDKWLVNDSLNVYVAQKYNGYMTSIKSNQIEVPIELDEDVKVEHEYPWLQDNYLIAHAFGGVNGKTYTNALEAFRYNYEEGHRIFEVDLSFTSDNILIGRHDWDASIYNTVESTTSKDLRNNLPQSYKEIQESSQQYTILSFEDICKLLVENEDMYIVTDTKFKDKQSVDYMFNYIVDIAERVDSKILDRIIIQIYDQAMYKYIMDIYPFKSVIYTLYISPDTDQQVIEFIKENGIKVVTMPVARATQGFVNDLNELGCYIFTHTVNSIYHTQQYIEKGIYGVYTDFLRYSDFRYDNRMYYTSYNANRGIKKINDLGEYLDYINKENYIKIFAIADEGTNAITDDIQNRLNSLGFEKKLQGNIRASYIGILDGNMLVTEQMDYKKIIGQYKVDDADISVESASFDYGNYASIKINGHEYAVNSRGLNIVVYDKNTKSVVDSIVFDTFEGLQCTRYSYDDRINQEAYMEEYLGDLDNENYVTIISVKDDASTLLTDRLRDKLINLGITADLKEQYRKSYIAVLDNKQIIYEELSDNTIEKRLQYMGVNYQIVSSNFNEDNKSSIKIDGKEYSVNNSGINIVVYDKRFGLVIDAICFSMNGYLHYTR